MARSSCPTLRSKRKHHCTKTGTNEATEEQENPELKIDRSPLVVNQRTRKRCRDDLIGPGSNGNGWRNIVENEQRRDQKPAANTKHARQKSNRCANGEQREEIDGKLRYRKVNTQNPNPKSGRRCGLL